MPMPYTLTKGPLLTLLENTLNPKNEAERATRNAALAALKTTTPITQIPWVTSAPVAGITLPTQQTLDVRLDSDWFGKRLNTQGVWVDQPGFSGQTTGYWVGYYGDVEPVLREGLIRAIQVSLGIGRDDVPGTTTPREWPVEVVWKCPNPYFEVWVTWRRHGGQQQHGQVTMIIATPPDKFNRLTTDPEFPPDPPRPRRANALPAPPPPNEPVGMWLVSNKHHRQHFVDLLVDPREPERESMTATAVADTPGALVPVPGRGWIVPTPTTFWRDEGPVVVVAPPASAGGVDVPRSNAN